MHPDEVEAQYMSIPVVEFEKLHTTIWHLRRAVEQMSEIASRGKDAECEQVVAYAVTVLGSKAGNS